MLLASCAFLIGCGSLPSLEGRVHSTAFTDTADTRLGRAANAAGTARPGLSGVYPLLDSRDAFAARVLLAEAAERSLDVQYYIWKADMSGALLFKALRAAADRGVRVRLLLDDNNTAGMDDTLAALHAHPQIEVRLFNPFTLRTPRLLGYLTDFARLNRRMHNKSFTADNQSTIIGGRNVGDEYFGATDGLAFVDLDVLAIGPVVADVSADFDRYWASASAYPADLLLPAADPARVAQLADKASFIERDPAAAGYLSAVRDTPFVRQLLEGTLPLQWAPTRLVSDDPAKVLGKGNAGTTLPQQLRGIIGTPAMELELVSPYFVPGENGTAALVDMARHGVAVSVLTNAMEATDVLPVHAGYAKRRKALLRGGVKLYELRRLAVAPDAPDPPNVPAAAGRSGNALFQSSGSSLHAKTFSVDRSKVFIGSFNFDPRSRDLNTEMGFVIDSPALAGDIADLFGSGLGTNAYEVRLDAEGDLIWLEQRGDRIVRHEREPGAGPWQRFVVWIVSLLPVEWLL
jgi:cardiolipin synthase C